MKHGAAIAGPVALALALASPAARADMTKAQCVEANVSGQHARIEHNLTAARDLLARCADPACPALVRDDCALRLQEVQSALLAQEEESKRRAEEAAAAAASAPLAPAPSPALAVAPLPAPVRGVGWLPITALAVGGGGLVAGAIFSVVSHAKRTSGDALCPGGECPDAASSQVSSLDAQATTFGQAAVVSYVAGGAALVTGIVLLLTGGSEARRQDAARLVLVPALAPGFVGVAGEIP